MEKMATDEDEELEILQALEAGSLKPVNNAPQRIKSHQATAEATLKKDLRLNVHFSSRDPKS